MWLFPARLSQGLANQSPHFPLSFTILITSVWGSGRDILALKGLGGVIWKVQEMTMEISSKNPGKES